MTAHPSLTCHTVMIDLSPNNQPTPGSRADRELFRVKRLVGTFWLAKSWFVVTGEYVLQHLGRYTHRVAISNHRLVSFVDGQVTFLWRDSAHNNEQKPLTLSLDKFLRRFLLHILPKGFVRIRHFGFLACRRRSATLPLCFKLLSAAQEALTEEHTSSTEDASDLYRCPKCGGPMKVIERLTAAEIQLRSPPRISSAA
jgi:Putative transposase